MPLERAASFSGKVQLTHKFLWTEPVTGADLRGEFERCMYTLPRRMCQLEAKHKAWSGRTRETSSLLRCCHCKAEGPASLGSSQHGRHLQNLQHLLTRSPLPNSYLFFQQTSLKQGFCGPGFPDFLWGMKKGVWCFFSRVLSVQERTWPFWHTFKDSFWPFCLLPTLSREPRLCPTALESFRATTGLWTGNSCCSPVCSQKAVKRNKRNTEWSSCHLRNPLPPVSLSSPLCLDMGVHSFNKSLRIIMRTNHVDRGTENVVQDKWASLGPCLAREHLWLAFLALLGIF